ncbi:putative reverse transcriptase domain-containing protein [Tanacetum coccineum]|uniref:Reverse transcriptase domain-containing protein n=1 Tax=Tanacetum coccineum TaxID=301880 RepID=A0ABQ5I0M6_9ASTR
MPVELGSFDVIIGMDWLRRYHAVIVCDEKLVQVPYGNETLTFRGNESSNGRRHPGCRAAPVARAPYRLALSEMKELAEQLQELSDKGHVIDSRGIIGRQVRVIMDLSTSPRTPNGDPQLSRSCPKGIKFDWGEKEENAFQLIKQKLCSAPILALPEGSEDFVVYCDAVTQRLSAGVNAAREGDCLCFSTVKSSREELHHSRFGYLAMET